MFTIEVNGETVEVEDAATSLLEVLRDHLKLRAAKDGCSPQGQCGCCTVLVDGHPRVACVTAARRVSGRTVTTLEGLEPDVARGWAEALCATGGSQCGFCTPGIVVRLEGLRRDGGLGDPERVERSLAAHLCRCTGWQTIGEAAAQVAVGGPSAVEPPSRDLAAAGRRATIEGRAPQRVGSDVPLGRGGFADDSAPADALVAVPDASGEWWVAETLAEARRLAGKVQGRRSTRPPEPPLEVPPGEWDLTLRTSWVEPAYLELDVAWCSPGGEPSAILANGGAFGGKADSPVPAAARRLADRHGRPVVARWSREDCVRHGPKRPPVAAGIDADGSGVLRVVRTPGVAAAVEQVAPGLRVEEVDVAGPPTSVALRGAGWVEAAVLLAVVSGTTRIRTPEGAIAEAGVADGGIRVRLDAGEVLDEVVVRSYAVGAAHMALGWVTSEGLSVDPLSGEPLGLTVRSFGILPATSMPRVSVELEPTDRPAVAGGDAVFAAVAAAVWRHQGLPHEWPTGIGFVP